MNISWIFLVNFDGFGESVFASGCKEVLLLEALPRNFRNSKLGKQIPAVPGRNHVNKMTNI